MAVPEQTPYVGYTANGTTTEFPITFSLPNSRYLVVTVNKEVPPVGAYNVSNNKVIFVTAPISGAQVELYRETQLDRTNNYKAYDNSFRPETVNFDFDKIWQKLQEQHMIDAQLLARVKEEVEWRRANDKLLQSQLDMLNGLVYGVFNKASSDFLNEKLRELSSAIDAAAAAGAGANGWTDALIVTQYGRTQREKNAESISVKDFGAKGDGVTDDTASILNATNANIYNFPPGVYKITDYAILQDVEKYLGQWASLLYNGAILPISIVNQYITLSVPSVFKTINDAVIYASSVDVIPNGGWLSIRLADGIYDNLPTIEPRTTNGKFLEIIGNLEHPENVTLNFPNNGNNACGLKLVDGFSLYKIDGLTINGVGGWISHGEWNAQSFGAGVFVEGSGSTVIVGSSVHINKMYYGVASRHGAHVSCYAGVIVQEAGDVGFHAFGGTIIAPGCEAFSCSHVAPGLGFGFCAEANGFIEAPGAKAAYNSEAGIYTLSGGVIWAFGATTDHNKDGVRCLGGLIETFAPGVHLNSFLNTRHGVYAAFGGFIGINGGISDQNGGFGVLAEEGGKVDITGASIHDNGSGGCKSLAGLIKGDGARANNNTGSGFAADMSGKISGYGLSANSNTQWGFIADHLSIIYMPGWGTDASNLSGDYTSANGAQIFI